ncbi:MAG TPA: hypothetical protein VMH90_01600 [Thermoplasmata archaeon]|nr:hypothetical protein [Thermoplasmata archaeon]
MGIAPGRLPARLIALEGESGVGKSRLADRWASREPGVLVLPEAFDRFRPRPSLAVPDRRSLRRVELRLFREELRRYRDGVRARDRGCLVLADTGFLGPLTYSAGLARIDPRRDIVAELLAEYRYAADRGVLGIPDLTIVLEAPRATIRRRLGGDPHGHPPRFRGRHARIGRMERRLWTGPLAGAGGSRVVRMSAAGPPAAVAARLDALVRTTRLPPALAPAVAARRLAATLDRIEFGKR